MDHITDDERQTERHVNLKYFFPCFVGGEIEYNIKIHNIFVWWDCDFIKWETLLFGINLLLEYLLQKTIKFADIVFVH